MRLLLVLALCTIFTQQPRFEAVQTEVFGAGNALTNAWADYDGDNDLDLFVGFGGSAANRMYQNERGVFRDVGAEAGVAVSRATRAAAWGDVDGDGDADLLVGFAPGTEPTLRLYRNSGGKFTDVTAEAGLVVDSGAVRQLSWLDLEGDGDADLFIAWRDRPNSMFVNERGRFSDQAARMGLADTRKTVGAVWFDYGQDGDLDLYVANQDGDANGLFENQRGRFRDVAERTGVAWGGRTAKEPTNGSVRPCAADVNNDGLLDLFVANYGKNGLFLSRVNGTFEDVSEAWGIAVDGRHDTCAFADFDNDGLLDLYVNGTVTGGTSYRDYLYRNKGTRFEDVTPANVLALHASHGAQWSDYDLDGDMDLAISGTRPDATHALLRNLLPTAEAQLSIAVSLLGPGGAPVPGAEVRAYAAGARTLLGTRLVDTGSGYNSQNIMPAHFGLAFKRKVDIEVTVPTRTGPVTSGRAGIDPEEYRGRVLMLRIGANGRLVR